MKKHIVLMSMLLLVGCNSENITTEINPTETQVPVIATEVTPFPTFTPTTTLIPPTETPIPPTPTPFPMLHQPPDILFNVATTTLPECIWEANSQIWFAKYPYDTAEKILASSVYHYFYPVWVPDGESFLYVESKITRLVDGVAGPEGVGTDSIWIMKADGSEKHKVSDDYPRFDYQNGLNCTIGHHISGAPQWSPDGKYITFRYVGETIGYYLLDVENSETVKFPKTFYEPHWRSPSEFVAMNTAGDLMRISFNDLQDIAYKEIPKPDLIRSEYISSPSVLPDGNLIVNIRDGNTNDFVNLATYNFDLTEWTILIPEGNNRIWDSPIYGEKYAVQCDLIGLAVIDRISWELVGIGVFDKEGYENFEEGLYDIPVATCISKFARIINLEDKGEYFVLGEDKGGFWMSPVIAGDRDAEKLFGIQDFNISTIYRYLIAYSLRE